MTFWQRAALSLAALLAGWLLSWALSQCRDPWTHDAESRFGRFTPEEWATYRQKRRL